MYLIGARLLATFQRKRAAEVLEQEAEVLHYERISAAARTSFWRRRAGGCRHRRVAVLAHRSDCR